MKMALVILHVTTKVVIFNKFRNKHLKFYAINAILHAKHAPITLLVNHVKVLCPYFKIILVKYVKLLMVFTKKMANVYHVQSKIALNVQIILPVMNVFFKIYFL
jgi:hypothetical protein